MGSENSCNGGRLETCPIAAGFVTDEDAEALEIGRIVQRDGDHLPALRAYLVGRKRGQSTANAPAEARVHPSPPVTVGRPNGGGS